MWNLRTRPFHVLLACFVVACGDDGSDRDQRSFVTPQPDEPLQNQPGGAGAAPPGAPPGAGASPGAAAPPVPTGGTAGSGSGAPQTPTDVTFDWPETVPGFGCRAGHYVGAFAGVWSSSLTVFPLPIPVSGTVDLWLAESQNGEFLEITSGSVTGLANDSFPYSAEVVGRLNCVTNQIEGGFLKNGVYNALGIVVTWEGPMSADYDPLTGSLVNGTWQGSEMLNPVFGGDGTWQAGWTP